MNFDSSTQGVLEILGQKIPIEVEHRNGKHVEIRTKDEKPSTFSGERQGNRITGVVADERGPARFSMELEPALPHPRDHAEAWAQDLAYADRKLPQMDRSFTPATRERFHRTVSQMEANVRSLDDPHILVGLAKAVTFADNAHTRLYLVRHRTEVRQYPIRVWWFQNELRVVRATSEHIDLLGCEVLKIGSHPIATARSRVTPLYSGTKSWADYMSTYTLTSPEVLFGLDLIPGVEQVRWTFACPNKTQSRELAPLPLRKTDQTVESWANLGPEPFEPEPGLKGMEFAAVPLYLRHLDQNYWFEHEEESGLLYFQFNRCAEQAGYNLAEFGANLETALRDRKVRALVVDLRFNTGGDLDLARGLMDRLQAEVGDRPVYVIIGRATFSAGLYHAAQWKQSGKAVFIGEPVGDRLDFWSEGGNLILPNSGIAVHFANAFHSYSRKEYLDRKPYFEDLNIDSLAPDYPTSGSFNDYVKGRDPAMDTVTRLAAKVRAKYQGD